MGYCINIFYYRLLHFRCYRKRYHNSCNSTIFSTQVSYLSIKMSVILMLSKCIFRQALIMNIVLTSLVLQKQAVVLDKTFKNNFLPYI